jgi:hypothetical protein
LVVGTAPIPSVHMSTCTYSACCFYLPYDVNLANHVNFVGVASLTPGEHANASLLADSGSLSLR